MRKNLLLALLVFCTTMVSIAQIKITGKVTSADDGSGMPGVTVTIKGTGIGTQTSASGDYSITAASNQILVYSFVGMESIEENVGNRVIINVVMENSVRGLSEVVVTGYGSQIKRDLTGNIAKIKSSDLAEVPTTSFETSMQGKAAGVQINQGSGKLGQAMQIRVRGQSSVSASNRPTLLEKPSCRASLPTTVAGFSPPTSPLLPTGTTMGTAQIPESGQTSPTRPALRF